MRHLTLQLSMRLLLFQFQRISPLDHLTLLMDKKKLIGDIVRYGENVAYVLWLGARMTNFFEDTDLHQMWGST